jgi:hypothetical protein
MAVEEANTPARQRRSDVTHRPNATVSLDDGRNFSLDMNAPFLFGRIDVEDVVGLDPHDTGLSRVAGRILYRGGWLVMNDSASRPLLVEYPRVVRHHTIAPGSTARLDGPAVIIVPGGILTHALRVTVPVERPAGPAIRRALAMHKPTDADPLHHADHLALVAIGEGYLRRWPRHDPNPRSYEDAARALGVSSTALRRRIERLREHLAHRGDFIAAGPHALRDLVEHYIDTGSLAVGDLDLLRARRDETQNP